MRDDRCLSFAFKHLFKQSSITRTKNAIVLINETSTTAGSETEYHYRSMATKDSYKITKMVNSINKTHKQELVGRLFTLTKASRKH